MNNYKSVIIIMNCSFNAECLKVALSCLKFILDGSVVGQIHDIGNASMGDDECCDA